MKKILLFILLSLPCLAGYSQININLSGYPLVTTGWSYGSSPTGVATVIDSTFRLTSSTTGTASYIYYNTGINMAGWCEWTADFDFKVSGSGTLADGFAFFFLTNPPLTASTGAAIGLPANPNGIMLVFDTYDNNSTPLENPQISLLGYTGTTPSYVEGSATGRLCAPLNGQTWVYNALWHHAKVKYHLGNINVYFDYSPTPNMTSTVAFPMSINGYFGFSGSTGALTSTQLIKSVAIVVNDCLAPSNNGPVCQADTMKLFATGDSTGATYYWYGPNGFTSTLQNPTKPNVTYLDSGDYHVVKTYGGVADTQLTHFSIKLNPVVTAGSNSPLCLGNTINLTSGPLSTGETFSWTGPGTYTSAVQNPVITPSTMADTGFYTVIATLNGCTDTSTVHVDITHVYVPTDSSNSPLCVGDVIKLFANDAASGVSWSWVGPAGSGWSSTLQNPTINATSTIYSGVYTVTATLGTCTASDTILVTVNRIPGVPLIVPTTRVCSGSTITLIVDPTTLDPGAVYHWSGPDGFSSTLTSPVLTNVITAQSGLYTVYASIGNCVSTATHNNFVIDSTPEAPTATNNGALCSDSTLMLYSGDGTAGVSYSWTGPGGFTSPLQNVIRYNATTAMSGNYTVTATLGLCSNSTATTVLVNQTPKNPIYGSNSPVCQGGLLNLNASFTPYTGIFHWSGPNAFTSLLQNPSINNVTMAANGIYTVYEISNGCTSDTVSFPVVINPTPVVPVVTSNSPVCENGTLLLHANDVTAGVTYSWSGPAGFSSVLQDPVINSVTPAAGGLYTVTATLGNCSSIGTTNVVITSTPTITVSSNSPVCTGDTLKLSAVSAAGNTFSWIGPYVFTSASPSPTRFPVISEYAGVYQVTTTEPGGCIAVGYDTVIIRQSPPAPWVTWLTFCQYDYAPPLMAVDATNVLWFPTNAAVAGAGTTTPPIPNTTIPGVYFFYLNQTQNGCTSPMDSIQVVVNPKPIVTLAPGDTAICPRDSINYRTTCTDPLATYKWYPFYNLSDTVGKSAVAHPVADIVYHVVTTSLLGCSDTATSNVTVYPKALVSISVGDSVSLYPGESYQIEPFTNCTSFNWFPPEGLDNSNVANPTATPDANTLYIVTGYTENGCKARDSIYFHVNGDNIYAVPNAFTPGTGVNNTFKLLIDGIGSLNYFRVYNRWGELVFETQNPSNGWDGSYKGEPQPMGVYVYDIQAVSKITGKIKNIRGNVTLLR